MLDYALLDALAEVIRHGSFERAAKALNVSPSAVSQRVKLLEERVGSVLVKRGQPCVATTSGALLCRHTERVRMLEAELSGHMPAFAGAQAAAWPTLRVAVNDDSVATWFVDAVGPFCAQSGTLLDLVIDDQDYTAERIRDGSVQGAVTALAEPIQGCRSTRLGRMRYHAVCSPAFHARYFGNGVNRDALRRAPCVMFNPKDSLQARFIRRVTRVDLDPLDSARRRLSARVRGGARLGHVSGADGRAPDRRGRAHRFVGRKEHRHRALLAELATVDRLAGRVQRGAQGERRAVSRLTG